MNTQIDTEKTLERLTEAEIRIAGWCRARKVSRGRFYAVINGQTLKSRYCYEARRIFSALKKEGLLVLKPDHDNNDNQEKEGCKCQKVA